MSCMQWAGDESRVRHLLHIVSICALNPFSGIAHRNDPWRDVREIQVKSVQLRCDGMRQHGIWSWIWSWTGWDWVQWDIGWGGISDGVGSDGVGSDGMGSDGVESDGVESGAVGYRMGWDQMGWDRMG